MALVQQSKLRIRPLLKLNDRLRKLSSHENDINVTSIVAVGDQSHGKTSVIEALSGIDLPRGEGIKTRVPLVLMLRNHESSDEEYALIKAHDIKEKRIRLEDISHQVDHYTTLLTDTKESKCDVLDKPIELTVFRRDQDDLTLIDLPGMTRVAICGQHSGIEATIMRMYKRYMTPKETVLLNIVSAMVDFSTSKSLQMSRELDPSAERTLLCVTKVDQHHDKGLLDKVQKAGTQLGLSHDNVFCVRNRSQPENEQGLSLSSVRALENEFLENHTELFALSSNQKGICALSRQLALLQLQRIQSSLPVLDSKIQQRISELESSLSLLGPTLDTEFVCRVELQRRLFKCMRTLQDELTGRTPICTGGKQILENTVKLCVDVKDLKSTRQRTEFGASLLPYHWHEGMFGVRLCLDVTPRYNKGWRESKDPATDSVGVFINWELADDTNSITCDFKIEAFDADGTLVGSVTENNQVFKLNHTRGYGSRSLIPALKANGLSVVSFRATVTITDMDSKVDLLMPFPSKERKKVSSDQENITPLLCSEIQARDDQLGTNIHRLFSNRYFFSAHFRQVVEVETKARSGASGLPGAIVPEPAMAILATLRSKLPPLVACYVNVIADLVLGCVRRIIGTAFEDLPKLHTLVLRCIDDFYQKQQERALDLTGELLALEDTTLHTHNHYFMDTVQNLRKLLLVADSPDSEAAIPPAFEFLRSDVKSLRGLSNMEQRHLDLQIEIFAFWKVMKKRLIDYVHLAARRHLAVVPLLGGKLQTSLLAAIEGDSRGYMELMAPSPSLAATIQRNKARLAALKEASQLLRQAKDAC